MSNNIKMNVITNYDDYKKVEIKDFINTTYFQNENQENINNLQKFDIIIELLKNNICKFFQEYGINIINILNSIDKQLYYDILYEHKYFNNNHDDNIYSMFMNILVDSIISRLNEDNIKSLNNTIYYDLYDYIDKLLKVN